MNKSRFHCPVHNENNVYVYDTPDGIRFVCFDCGPDIEYTLGDLPSDRRLIDNVIWPDES